MATVSFALAEDFDAVLGHEQGHRPGSSEPAAPGGAGGLLGALASHRLLARWTPRTALITALAGFGGCLAALAATLTVRQQNVPPDHYTQISATAASFRTGSYALGAAVTGLLAGVLTGRQLLLAIAAGQVLALTPLLRPGLAQAPAARWP